MIDVVWEIKVITGEDKFDEAIRKLVVRNKFGGLQNYKYSSAARSLTWDVSVQGENICNNRYSNRRICYESSWRQW